ncbi:MAG: hypothetical protein AAGE03_02980 [Pseudomonadota bacterium]
MLLTACGAPHPLDRFDRSGIAHAGGHDFRVNWNLETAQATRMNVAWRPDPRAVTRSAVQATETVTGCVVIPGSAVGDIALVNLSLDCSRSP